LPHDRHFADDLTRLPAQPLTSMRIMRLGSGTDTSVGELARIVDADPALSARVLRLANAPYYGLSGRISSASRAVVLLGFDTVRALALGAAASLMADEVDLGPEGLWTHNVATAAACAVVARRIGAPAQDAFSAGLLKDVGVALLHRRDPQGYTAMLRSSGRSVEELNRAETRSFDVTHAAAGAMALEAWGFPQQFVNAVASHHLPLDRVIGTLARVVHAGQALALTVYPWELHPPAHEPVEVLGKLGLSPGMRNSMLREIETEVDHLVQFLAVA
jgi:putative nucleotidyltransferase with HDIG domain